MVVHGRGDLFGCEFNVGATALLTAFPHEGGFVGGFVGVGAGHCCEDLIEALWSDLEDTGFQNVCPIVLREIAKGRAIDDGAGHFWTRCCCQ